MGRIPEVTVNNSQHANLGNACACYLFGLAAARRRGICRKFILARKRGFCLFLLYKVCQCLCNRANKLESFASHNFGQVFHRFLPHFFKNPEGFRPRSKPPRRKLSYRGCVFLFRSRGARAPQRGGWKHRGWGILKTQTNPKFKNFQNFERWPGNRQF